MPQISTEVKGFLSKRLMAVMKLSYGLASGYRKGKSFILNMQNATVFQENQNILKYMVYPVLCSILNDGFED